MDAFGRVLLVVAAVLALVGLVLVAVGKGLIPRLPGDLTFGRGNVRVYLPLGTMLLVSIVLTLVVNLFLRR
ncbi:MAG TPA: DUF2905 domain-containing protein [Actinomycetota bacterium]|nr:DUF2905 domain-containing protein [Actinomycetota bacterium]